MNQNSASYYAPQTGSYPPYAPQQLGVHGSYPAQSSTFSQNSSTAGIEMYFL